MYVQQTINAKGRLIDLSKPIVMGVLNLTPDSFFDGGKWLATENYLGQVEQMLKDGAEIIDVGAMSTRPGSESILEAVELDRAIPAIQKIAENFPDAIISIDSWRAVVVEAAVKNGASIVNDISGGSFDEKLWQTVAAMQVPYILMHIQGKPENMQQNPTYNDLLTEMADYFIEKIARLKDAGIKDIILDPGFGFGKTLTHNYRILANLQAFSSLGLPILAGVSRKSMICKALGVNPEAALNGTTAVHVLALTQGAKILRVHDVKEAAQAIKIWELYKNELLYTTFIPKFASE